MLSISTDCLMGQQLHDEMPSLEGAVFKEWLQSLLLDAQDSLHPAQHSQMVEANRSWRPCTVEVADFVSLTDADLPMTYMNQDPSSGKLQHPWARPCHIIKYSWQKAVKWELLADMMIHDTVHVSRLQKYTTDRAREKSPLSAVHTVRDIHGHTEDWDVVEGNTSRKWLSGVTSS